VQIHLRAADGECFVDLDGHRLKRPHPIARWRVVEETDRFVIVEIDEQEASPT